MPRPEDEIPEPLPMPPWPSEGDGRGDGWETFEVGELRASPVPAGDGVAAPRLPSTEAAAASAEGSSPSAEMLDAIRGLGEKLDEISRSLERVVSSLEEIL